MDEKKIEKIKAKFGERVKEARQAQKMTQLDLAIKVGVDVRQIKRIESAEVNTSLTTIYMIISALGISSEDLFDFKA